MLSGASGNALKRANCASVKSYPRRLLAQLAIVATTVFGKLMLADSFRGSFSTNTFLWGCRGFHISAVWLSIDNEKFKASEHIVIPT